MMNIHEFFKILDLNGDGELSRSELHVAAGRWGWHWPEAPIFAVFDLLTLAGPLSEKAFATLMKQIIEDPLGPYGDVLLNAPHFSSCGASESDAQTERARKEIPGGRQKTMSGNVARDDGLASFLEREVGREAADDYRRLLRNFAPRRISRTKAALLIIDPQRSFTRGAWMRSIGRRGETDVRPIRRAFENCARALRENCAGVETMFTRCPFPPDSYGWDDSLAEIVGEKRLYFIKPGNSVLFPSANGFREWVERCIGKGKGVLVIGGCTLNSCVRVSAIETREHFQSRGLDVVVDLDLCGARMKNYGKSPMYGGLSAVESAVREMASCGVRVARRVYWM